MNGNTIKAIIGKLPKLAKEGIKRFPWRKTIDYAKKPSTWGVLVGGIAGGGMLRQPKVNKLKKEVRVAHSREERLQVIIRRYHEEYVIMKAKMEVLQAQNNVDEAKKNEEYGRSLIMYQYATKEYIEICLKTRNDRGKRNLSEKELKHYRVFQRVLYGEKLAQEDAISIQKYIYPKYKRQIDGLIEFDFDELLAEMVTL